MTPHSCVSIDSSKPDNMRSPTTGNKVKRACEGCRYRKVKCDGKIPCFACTHLDLRCVYSLIPGKRKPGVRGRLVAQLRQKQTSTGAISAESPTSAKDSDDRQRNGLGGSLVYDHAKHRTEIVDEVGTERESMSHQPRITSVTNIINRNASENTFEKYSQRPSAGAAAPCQPDTSSSPATAFNSSPTDTFMIGHYRASFLLDLVPDFEKLIYPMNPVITPGEIRAAILTMDADHEDAALSYAFAAATISATRTSCHHGKDGTIQMMELIQLSLEAHRRADVISPPSSSTRVKRAAEHTEVVLGELPVSVKRIMTCLFLEISYIALKLFDRSFTILREAISLTLLLKIHTYTTQDALLDQQEIARRQRLYWECFIHERFNNVMSGCPCTLVPLRTGLPLADSSIPTNIDLGFRSLVRLYMALDDEFLRHWGADVLQVHTVPRQGQQQQPHRQLITSPVVIAARLGPVASISMLGSSQVTAKWIECKQRELDEGEADFVRVVASSATRLTELQYVDLCITRLWLRTLVWQLALSHGLLRSISTEQPCCTQNRHHAQSYQHRHHQCLFLHYPATRLLHQLRTLISRLKSINSVSLHGSGILQKLFEIISTIAHVLTLPPNSTVDTKSCIEDFVFLASFLFQFERTPKKEREYLREKIEVLQRMYVAIDTKP